MTPHTYDELALRHGTDKFKHGYMRYYARHITGKMQVDAKNILEIGVWHGQSLWLWADVFPNAIIHGIDIDPKCAEFSSYDGRQIRIHIGDQTDEKFLTSVAQRTSSLVMIVDDGSHKMGHAEISFKVLFPFLTSGGLYVIEDLHTAYMANYRERGFRNTMEWLYNMVDCMNTTANKPTVKSISFYRSLCIIEKA
jgi:predicted O-methyltransferase YrrM